MPKTSLYAQFVCDRERNKDNISLLCPTQRYGYKLMVVKGCGEREESKIEKERKNNVVKILS